MIGSVLFYEKKKLSSVIIIEYLLYFALIIFVSSGKLDSLPLPDPVITIYIAIFVGSVFFILLLLAKNNREIISNTRTLLLLSLMVIIVVHITMNQTKTLMYPDSPLFPFYYIIIIIYAALGNGILWIASFSLFLLSEFGTIFLEGITVIQKTNDYKLLFDKVLCMIPEIAFVFITGTVCYFVTTIGNHSAVLSKKHKNTSFVQNKHANNSVKNVIDSNTQISNTKLTNQQQKTLDSTIINEDELSSVVFFMRKYFRAYSALGFIYDTQKKVFRLNAYNSRSMSIIKNIVIPVGDGIIGNLALEQNTFLSGNLKNYDFDLTYYSTDETINSILAVPIFSSQNELLGALVVDSLDKLAFRDNHKEILNRFSHLAAALINNVLMRIHEKHVADQFQLFYKASQKFSSTQRLNQVLGVLFQILQSNIQFTRIFTLQYNVKSNACTVIRIINTLNKNDFEEGFSFQLNNGLCSEVIKTKKTVIINDLKKYSKQCSIFVPEVSWNPQIQSLMILPLSSSSVYSSNVICIENNQMNYFSEELGQLISTIVNNASIAYQKAILYEKMELLATTDGLTQLCNHRTFQDHLSKEITRSQRYNHTVSLLLMDIDHFKKFNDKYGHQTGDLVLQEVARNLSETIRINDVPARYGGEEFAVILPETSPHQASVIGERIRKKIESLVISNGKQNLKVTVSIGCATIPDHAKNKQEIINFADTAMYNSKKHGRNQFTLYSKKNKYK